MFTTLHRAVLAVVALATMVKASTDMNVNYMDNNIPLQGFLALPDNAMGPLPVVLHVPTWNGISSFEKGRAQRTADELGVAGFAVSIYSDQETTQAANGDVSTKSMIAGRYFGDHSLYVSRLDAAITELWKHNASIDMMSIAAAGYCLGGNAVLSYAKQGAANASGVSGVFSYHGGLGGLMDGAADFAGVQVAVANGARDSSIPMTEGSKFQAYMTDHNVVWDFATYGQAAHGFTHPMQGSEHFHFEQVAEARSWESLRDFLVHLNFTTEMVMNHQITAGEIIYTDSSDGTALTGFLAYPTGASGRLPALIHAHTWVGLSDFEKERARRTAAELGYVGLAVSLFTDAQTTQAAADTFSTGFSVRRSIVGSFTPDLFDSRLSAATAFLKQHHMVDTSKIGAMGYCFGGSAVVEYARTGMAAMDGVKAVASFHGGILRTGPSVPRQYCPTRVAVFNGAGDESISDMDITSLTKDLEMTRTFWEFTNYSGAEHGFTHPTDGTDHFHYDMRAETRSWEAMANFFNTTFEGQGIQTSCTNMDAWSYNFTYMDGNVKLHGFIAIPENSMGPLPVVLHVPTWNGISNFERGRAQRTADEFGVVGFAVSIYSDQETTDAADGNTSTKQSIAGRYFQDHTLYVSRLDAAIAELRHHAPHVDMTKLAAAGYCLGGNAVLSYAKQGAANASGVSGVFSYHGGLGGLMAGTADFGDVQVAVANGARDSSIPMSDGSNFQAYMTENDVVAWDFATYGQAAHGFTHPMEGDDHFHFEKVAEARSWDSLRDFLVHLRFTTKAVAAHAVTEEEVTFTDNSDGTTLKGFLAYPTSATGRLPVVAHAHTWAGLTDFEKGRARRTAAELGYVGFAGSLFTDEQATQAASDSATSGWSVRRGIVGSFTPELFSSRLGAVATYLKSHSKVDTSKIGAAGYCFGGTAVMEYARTGMAASHGVKAVASFHGGIGQTGPTVDRNYCPTRVAIFNGAADPAITDAEITSLTTDLEMSNTFWEFTNYSGAQHGFTHPSDSTAHFHYDQRAETRSWEAMAHFFMTTFAGEGVAVQSSCTNMMVDSTTLDVASASHRSTLSSALPSLCASLLAVVVGRCL